ncbi:RNA-binding protein Musashi homolog 1-like isoform X2 [Dysidea avara]|uniref:RNA-binding protein Musashi homolog 1-like isoform X2 n=1 Tax=Dysidea avara TaxID=196820 RepID=UPI003329BBB5
MPVAAEKQSFGAKEQDSESLPAGVSELDDPKEQSGDVFEAEGDIQSPLVYKQPQGKIFVGGISWQTSREAMKNLFEKFGKVLECQIIQDPVTKRSRGFGFVTFEDQESVRGVLDAHERQPLTLDHKKIDPKVAVSKRDGNRVQRNKKVFIGGVPSDATVADIINHFKQFGDVKDAQLMYDKETRRHRGFGFVTFETEEAVDEVCSIQYHDIRNKKVEVKEAIPKDAMMMQKNGRLVSSQGYNWSNQYMPYYQYPWAMMAGYGPYMYGMAGRNGYRARTRDYMPATTYYNTGYVSPGDQTNSGNDYYGFPVSVCSPTETQSLSTSSVDYMTDSFQNMSITSYGHTPTIPRGMYPTLAAQMNSNGSYRGDVTMVSAATSNTMNGITSPSYNGYSGNNSAFTLVSTQQQTY